VAFGSGGGAWFIKEVVGMAFFVRHFSFPVFYFFVSILLVLWFVFWEGIFVGSFNEIIFANIRYAQKLIGNSLNKLKPV
jgi:hypothetical protein